MRSDVAGMQFFVRTISTESHFAAGMFTKTDNGNYEYVTTGSFGNPKQNIVPIVVGQEYTVKVIHDDAGMNNIFFDGVAFASGNMDFGTFDALLICRGIGGGAGNFHGTIRNLELGNTLTAEEIVADVCDGEEFRGATGQNDVVVSALGFIVGPGEGCHSDKIEIDQADECEKTCQDDPNCSFYQVGDDTCWTFDDLSNCIDFVEHEDYNIYQLPCRSDPDEEVPINLKQVTCDGTNTIKLDNIIDYDKAFEINFKFTSSAEHYGGLFGMRSDVAGMQFFVRTISTESHFAAGMFTKTDNGNYEYVTTGSFGNPKQNIVPIVVGQEYTVKVIHDDAGMNNIFFDGVAFASGNMDFGTFDALLICRGIGGGAGNFHGTIRNLELGNTLTVLLQKDELSLQKGSLITNLPKLPKAFVISFDVKANSYANTWQSVVHFTADNTNIATYGSRNPGVWFNHLSKKLHICSGINGNRNTCYNSGPINVGQWTTVQVSQTGSGAYSIELNGQKVKTWQNNDAREYTDVKVYAADPWYQPLNGAIRNFQITLE